MKSNIGIDPPEISSASLSPLEEAKDDQTINRMADTSVSSGKAGEGNINASLKKEVKENQVEDEHQNLVQARARVKEEEKEDKIQIEADKNDLEKNEPLIQKA